jgi:hypothetical protein
LEALTLKRLGVISAPIVVLNTNQYYQGLLDLMDRSVKEGFLDENHRRMWTVVEEPEQVLPALGLKD